MAAHKSSDTTHRYIAGTRKVQRSDINVLPPVCDGTAAAFTQ
jgi:hypothetical protein